MRVREVREALSGAALSFDRIEPILGGWASWTFSLDDRFMQWEEFTTRALPHLPPEIVDEVTARYVLPSSPEVFVHNDLGLEHVLVDDDGVPVGIIDFEDATIGDPEVDLVPLHAALGWPLSERMCFYRWVGSLHALVHCAEEDPSEIPAVVAELRRRLDLRPGQ